jgi:hypothetical protein
LSTALLFEDIVGEEDAFHRATILSKHHNQPGPELASQVFRDGPSVGIIEKNIDFILAIRTHGLNLWA